MYRTLKNMMVLASLLASLLAVTGCTTTGGGSASGGGGGGGIGEGKGRAVFGTESDLMFRTLA